MNPDFEKFEAYCGKGNLVPIYMELPGDLDTPVSAFMKMRAESHAFLLESVEGGEKWARYSFLGCNPKSVLKTVKGGVEIHDLDSGKFRFKSTDIVTELRSILSSWKPVKVEGLPEFFGGAVGYFSYDMIRRFERIPNLGKKDPDFPEAAFMITRDLVVFDNFKHTIILVTVVDPSESDSPESAYALGLERLNFLKAKLDAGLNITSNGSKGRDIQFASNLSQTDFEKLVIQAKKHIKAGDIIQVVLSQKFSCLAPKDNFSVYRSLRMINPSPYMFFLRFSDESLAGSSPEVMVRLRDDEATLRPIAGTRPRGSTLESDLAFETELLSDEKESAEHVMLVDLARNDLGRIAGPGSVVVDSFKTIERYSHVMHMVSNVKAQLAEGKDAFDVLKATFPAGTLTGAPKIRAMEIIEDLEPEHRGPYGGCVGYFSYSGAMDMGITIRSVMMKNGSAYFQAGAGIVADSVPESEYMETIKKAEAMRKALIMASELKGGLE